jgi:hypothetical protein
MRGAISESGSNDSLAAARVWHCGGQGVHREVESEGHEEKYQAVIDGGCPADEPVGQRWDKVEPVRGLQFSEELNGHGLSLAVTAAYSPTALAAEARNLQRGRRGVPSMHPNMAASMREPQLPHK